MKKSFKIGALVGGFLGFSIAIGMDLIMGGTINSGGWAEAVANDLNLFFDKKFDRNDLIVILCVIIIIGIMVIISAILGGLTALLLWGFFDFMTKKK